MYRRYVAGLYLQRNGKITRPSPDADGRSGAPVECGLVDLLFPINKKLWTALMFSLPWDRSLRIGLCLFS